MIIIWEAAENTNLLVADVTPKAEVVIAEIFVDIVLDVEVLSPELPTLDSPPLLVVAQKAASHQVISAKRRFSCSCWLKFWNPEWL